MRPQVIIRYVCLVILITALFLFVSALISFLTPDAGALPLLYSAIVAALIGVFPIIFVPPAHDVRQEEGLAIVVVSWVLSAAIGTMPFILWGGEFTFTNAWFESVSGFTTTGSSILNDVEALPLGLSFWRSTTHWLGGIGIVVFMLAILPSFGQATRVLYRSEISDLASDNFQYRTRQTLRILLVVYVSLTVVETLCLWLLGMSLFDAVTNSFATVSTGGFSPRNLSVAYYHSPAIELVIILFMVLSGVHFGVLFVTLTGKSGRLWESTIVRYYMGALLVGVLLVALDLHGEIYDGWLDSFRYAAFQLVSVGSSTGFATADSAVWPGFSVLILIFFTLQCACAGSTSGGIKADRLVIFWKTIESQLKKMRHPQAVTSVKIDGYSVGSNIIEAGLLYISVYLAIVFVSSLALTLLGMDILSAFSGSAAAMGNVGPGFGTVGSMGNFSGVPEAGKWILSIVMLLGRLEVFSIFLLFFKRYGR